MHKYVELQLSYFLLIIIMEDFCHFHNEALEKQSNNMLIQDLI